jgi:hypothetical protein
MVHFKELIVALDLGMLSTGVGHDIAIRPDGGYQRSHHNGYIRFVFDIYSSVCAIELPRRYRNNFSKGTDGKLIGYQEFGRFGTGFGFLLETGVTRGTH